MLKLQLPAPAVEQTPDVHCPLKQSSLHCAAPHPELRELLGVCCGVNLCKDVDLLKARWHPLDPAQAAGIKPAPRRPLDLADLQAELLGHSVQRHL